MQPPPSPAPTPPPSRRRTPHAPRRAPRSRVLTESNLNDPGNAGPDPVSVWRLWQIADTAFPAGGFLHSNGLESAIQHGAITRRDELPAYLETSLRQTTRAALPFVVTAHRQPESLAEWDTLCDAWTSNHVANRASRLQGRAFSRVVATAFDLPPTPTPDPGHFAPVFGALIARLGVRRPDAVRLFLFLHLRSVVSAAIRLNLVGPLEAQRIQDRLAPVAEALGAGAVDFTLDDLAQTAPLIDVWQAAHDRLESRLFHT